MPGVKINNGVIVRPSGTNVIFLLYPRYVYSLAEEAADYMIEYGFGRYASSFDDSPRVNYRQISADWDVSSWPSLKQQGAA